MKTWTQEKPKTPGAYYVRGFNFGSTSQDEALVEVREGHSELICNLHSCNSEPPGSTFACWSKLSNMSDSFEWCGPLVPHNV